jgi:hypothetical protein
MKRHGFWETFDSFFSGGPFDVLFDILLVVNCLLLLLVIYGGWPTPYTGPKKQESQLAFERHNDQVFDEFIRPKIEAKYNVKTLRAKTDAKDNSVNVRIETDGTGRYEEIAEDILLRLAPKILGGFGVEWSRAPDVENDGTPKDSPSGWKKGNQMRYILEFDHGSDDGGATVFFANGMRYPGPTSSDPVSPRRQEKSPQWHSNDYYNFH